MTPAAAETLDALWSEHAGEWRDPGQITSQWEDAAKTEPRLLRVRERGEFWAVLERLAITLLVTREYEHLVIALSAGRRQTFMRLPHPSGLAVDRERREVHLASTRNPNQIYRLAPVTGAEERSDVEPALLEQRPLVPVTSQFLPGCLYLHDLALIGGVLHGNAVGQNAIVELGGDGRHSPVWWPRSVEVDGRADLSRNHLQLNSIASGADIASSFFSASVAAPPGRRRPGHRDFAVDRRGVIFSGATREPVAHGLTRPHSARLHRGELWVDDSGYGEVGRIRSGAFEAVARLPGWTRGLALCKDVAFVGTSRVIPRFRRYAPGLDVDRSVCAVHAVDIASGRALGSLVWPYGNQIFAVDWLPARATGGFAFPAGRSRPSARLRRLFYSFRVNEQD